MTKLISRLDSFTECLGRALSLATFSIMLITFLVVVMRYGFNAGYLDLWAFKISSIALQESVLYLHAMLFMLASGYTLKHNAHVRVDVFYRNFSPQSKAWVDLLGTLLLLLPMSGFILYTSLDFVAFSWRIKEHSAESEGLAYVYVLKTLIPVMAGLLIFQGLVDLLRNGLLIAGIPVSHPAQETEHL